jgi:HAMP domain-containing protein
MFPFDPKRLISTAGEVPHADRYRTTDRFRFRTGQQASSILYLTSRREDSVNATAIPLKSDTGAVLAVLTVAISRSGMVEAQQHIRAIAYGVAAGGILLAILASLWIAARVSRPIEQLAHAAEEVAAGNWETHVPQRGRDEISVLARSFNHMTGELVASATGWCRPSAWPPGASWPAALRTNSRIRSFRCNSPSKTWSAPALPPANSTKSSARARKRWAWRSPT